MVWQLLGEPQRLLQKTFRAFIRYIVNRFKFQMPTVLALALRPPIRIIERRALREL